MTMQLRDVSVDVQGRNILRGLELEFRAGEITAIRKAGVLDGSSTLLRCCAGIETSYRGKILWRGSDIRSLTPEQRFRELGYCHERGGLISLFDVYGNLALPLIYHFNLTAKHADRIIRRVADPLEIAPLLSLEPFQLNDVQTRLVNLARALCMDCSLIMVDEIQTGMSLDMIQRVAGVLRDQADAGKTVIMITTAGDLDDFAHEHLILRKQRLEDVE